jgi:hypothetical protein
MEHKDDRQPIISLQKRQPESLLLLRLRPMLSKFLSRAAMWPFHNQQCQYAHLFCQLFRRRSTRPIFIPQTHDETLLATLLFFSAPSGVAFSLFLRFAQLSRQNLHHHLKYCSPQSVSLGLYLTVYRFHRLPAPPPVCFPQTCGQCCLD